MKTDSVLATIGNTPHIRLSRMFPDHEVWVKSERANPAGSIKDRIALAMIEDAEKQGKLRPGGTIVEPTSGNTGIGLAMVAAVKGYKLILVMPESMSIERRRLMLAYGASFDLTPKELGMKGSLARAAELVAEIDGAWMPQQFENEANIAAHASTTAQEILNDFADSPIDVVITGVGTGGHLTACAEVLKAKWPELKAYAVEPTLSPVISGGQPSPHPIQGIGAGFVPEILDTDIYDEVVTEYNTRHAQSLRQLVAGGTELRQVPEDVLIALGNAAGEIIAEVREDDDELVRQIVGSFLEYRSLMAEYMAYGDNGLMNARALPYDFG